MNGNFYHRLLVALWAVVLTFLILGLTGQTNFISSMLGTAGINMAVEMSFFVLSGFLASLLWFVFPRPKRIVTQLLAMALPFFMMLFWFYTNL